MLRTAPIAIVAALLMLAGCATMFTKGGSQYRQGERALKAGDYTQAVARAIEALDKNPEFEEARALLDRAFTQGTQTWEEAIAQLESSGEQFAYDKIYRCYEALEKLHTVAADSAHAANLEVKSYSDKIAAAKETAAEAHYQAGVAALEAGDFRSARQAVAQFQTAQGILEGYKDASDLEATARELAIVSMAVYVPESQAAFFTDSFGRSVARSAGVEEFTEIVNASSMGVSGDASLDEVVSHARDTGADFVLYVTGTVSGETYGPTQGKPTEFYPATTGYELTAGYQSALNGSFALVDVAAGDTVVDQPLEVVHSDEITVRVFEPTTQGQYTLHTDGGEVSGTFAVLETSLDATGSDWADSEIGKIVQETGFPYALDGLAVCVPEVELDEVRQARSFHELGLLLDGKAILPGVEAFVIPEYAAIAVYSYTDSYDSKGEATMQQFSSKATEILDCFREAAPELARTAVDAGILLPGKAARHIGQQVASTLR